MRARNALLVVWLAVAALACSTCAWAEAEEPAELVRALTGKLRASARAESTLIARQPERALHLVDQVVGPHVDFERISRWVLGKHWRRASAKQRELFLQEFRKLVFGSYSRTVTEHSDVTVDYLPTRYLADGAEALVRTQVPQPGGPPLSIHYRMAREPGSWVFVDLIVEGISLVATYRSSFGVEIKRSGLDGLIRRLSEKNASAS